MTGGLFQLIVYGIEDLILTHNPNVTFFKSVFKRYTNFTTENIQLNFTGEVDFGKQLSCTIPKKGDLINKMYIKLVLPKINYDENCEYVYAWVKYIGYAIIKSIKLNIGGKIIDEHTNDWLYIWNELTTSKSKKNGYNKMIGHVPDNYDFNLHFKSDIAEYTCYIPINFWFCKDSNLSLPLCALNAYDIKININLNILENCLLQANIVNTNETISETKYQRDITGIEYLENMNKLQCYLLADYFFLDKKEKELFINSSHTFCVEQLQYLDTYEFMGDFSSVQLNFNHPVKELLWCFIYDRNIKIKNYFCYENYEKSIYYTITYNQYFEPINVVFTDNEIESSNPVNSVNLYVNGEKRFAEQTGDYTSILLPYYYHTNTPNNGINVYSFALYPEKSQPSGTCNFSKIDESILENSLKTYYYYDTENTKILESGTGFVKIFAINYNIFKIKDGIGGFLYNN